MSISVYSQLASSAALPPRTGLSTSFLRRQLKLTVSAARFATFFAPTATQLRAFVNDQEPAARHTSRPHSQALGTIQKDSIMNITTVLENGAPNNGSHAANLGATNRYATRHSTTTEAGFEQQYPSTRDEIHHDRRLPGLTQLDIPPSSSSFSSGTTQQNNASSANSETPKHVRFIHLLDGGERSRLALSTNINAHDTTQSIIDAVRNFFGLFTGRLGFEDESGCHIIPSYNNFGHGGTIFLRGEPEETNNAAHLQTEAPLQSPTKTFPMLPPASNQPLSRPGSRISSGIQLAPGFEFTPQVSPTKNESFGCNPPGYVEHRGTDEWIMRLPAGSVEDPNGTGSKIASADISEANIVDGGRRKRAKFDTQDLPLFQPMQVPSTQSMSSASPVRRPPPQASSAHDGYALSHTDTTPQRAMSQRSSLQYNGPNRRRGVLPTPDHTTASAMSDEDVAWQLVSLSDIGRLPGQGRTSTSTLDDAFSGKANASDLGDEYSEEEEDAPIGAPNFNIYQDDQPRHSAKSRSHSRREADGETSGEDCEDGDDVSFKGASSEMSGVDRRKGPKSTSKHPKSKASKPQQGGKGVKKEYGSKQAPPSPRSLSNSSRKPSNASLGFTAPLTPLAPDETDLSSKPRCQRCRKSKKGCDRQRPCGRCKDAGLGIDDCVSEEETNNKKGRYGRHMGVIIKKDDEESMSPHANAHIQPQKQAPSQAPQLPPYPYGQKPSDEMFKMAQQGFAGLSSKDKKRKR
ncbi:hypothetical protein EJ05DRAFT_499534 [Pseudovirgaria hyperparasitica]|uniref:Zn(2)-C6 fungal-type domain-containing protein n=1 Tax=Pseudovirgaria hyperparasitica TaxID=470096 RepID=A0A6A6WAA6_9PEZI|nr:uncharacterized protein EJ05DRAFT_499534 [Pseudovirgaria hyperparasitica]KAF2759109.1 hypothetical protein EJ05DRAFT_499534 [Pseudovirgaria hyperparasitica]